MFKILLFVAKYNFKNQILIEFAFIILHNFINKNLFKKTDYFEQKKLNTQFLSILELDMLGSLLTILSRINKKRNRIINQMEINYIDILSCCTRIA